mmetsp:Transcript_6652/g.16002  ORF Transcript_6652/g.16002 Transcript_6652/m.16002 type:complete len:277 (-) Transcript_6652:58-888(-)
MLSYLVTVILRPVASIWLDVLAGLHSYILPHLTVIVSTTAVGLFSLSFGRLLLFVRRLDNKATAAQENGKGENGLLVLVGTQKGTSLHMARKLVARAKVAGFSTRLVSLKNYEVENLAAEQTAVVIVSTYAEGSPPDEASWFCRWLSESATDFRVGLALLQRLRFAVFGCGNKVYGDKFNTVARAADENLAALGGRRLVPVGLGDEDTNDMEAQFDRWSDDLLVALRGEGAAPAPLPKPSERSVHDGSGSEEEEEEEAAEARGDPEAAALAASEGL